MFKSTAAALPTKLAAKRPEQSAIYRIFSSILGVLISRHYMVAFLIKTSTSVRF
ncbi:hypothetical protein CEV33_0412 [Brucella grignonensis]|uniref:Uncharacterized protein n=1 Tax=Brucella grignonensis TaxID=94627 RepID=A0A256FFH1_9HYPH|nr:hypothetical protein CEV33_0412 [Brucella grignonensis]